ncbi:MAG: GTPase HflX, partial [Rubrivivax sp.]|nr:GTPase HflX [Rubrivivax sp.]
AASPNRLEQVHEVERVLAEIGAAQIAQIVVFNKCDRLEASQAPRATVDWFERPDGSRVRRVFVSALTGDGLDALRGLLADAVLGPLQPPAASPSAEPAPEGARAPASVPTP